MKALVPYSQNAAHICCIFVFVLRDPSWSARYARGKPHSQNAVHINEAKEHNLEGQQASWITLCHAGGYVADEGLSIIWELLTAGWDVL